MSVQVREQDPLSGVTVAFFGVTEHADGVADAFVLIINGFGEPVEFNYARAKRPTLLLWNEADLRRSMVRKFLVSLMGSLTSSPDLLFVRASQVPTGILGKEVEIPDLPWVRVDDSPISSDVATEEGMAGGEVYLVASREMSDDARAALEHLRHNTNLLEPFTRGETTLSAVGAGGDE
jgi:hypothetical protein